MWVILSSLTWRELRNRSRVERWRCHRRDPILGENRTIPWWFEDGCNGISMTCLLQIYILADSSNSPDSIQLTLWYINKTVEHRQRNSGFSQQIWWFSIVMLIDQRVSMEIHMLRPVRSTNRWLYPPLHKRLIDFPWVAWVEPPQLPPQLWPRSALKAEEDHTQKIPEVISMVLSNLSIYRPSYLSVLSYPILSYPYCPIYLILSILSYLILSHLIYLI